MVNKKLAIAIPTFERAEIVAATISSLIPELKEFSIAIYVSDNSLGDETKKVLFELKKQYEFIYYYKNRVDLGHDRNSFYVAQIPESDYVWLYGDSLLVKSGAIKAVLHSIEIYNPEIMSVNAANRDLDEASGMYVDHNSVLDNFGWHVTLTGATIYSRATLSSISQVVPDKFINFPQLSLIFESLSKNCSFYWENNKLIAASPNKKGYWVDTMFSIFIDDWSRAIRNLPESYDREIKEKVIIEHSLKSNIFNTKSLLKARFYGAYNLSLYKQYKNPLAVHSRLNSAFLMLIAIFPRKVLLVYFFFKGR